MKKNIVLFFIVMSLLYAHQVLAQFTSGGVSYDTIKTTTKRVHPIGYGYINIGVAIPFSNPFTSNSTLTTSFAADYEGIGNMGGNIGFDVGFGGVYALNGINRHLIRQLDLGIAQNFNFTYLPWSYNTLGDPYTTYDYNGFMIVSTSLAPALIINPAPNIDLHIDVMYKLGFGVTFGGGFENDGTYIIRREDPGFSFYHGPTINFRYSALIIGFEGSFVGDYGTMDVNGGGYLTCGLPLNNFAIKLGVRI